MHTVTLKADDRLYGQIDMMAKELHLSKSELIRRALFAYQETLGRWKHAPLLLFRRMHSTK